MNTIIKLSQKEIFSTAGGNNYITKSTNCEAYAIIMSGCISFCNHVSSLSMDNANTKAVMKKICHENCEKDKSAKNSFESIKVFREECHPESSWDIHDEL